MAYKDPERAREDNRRYHRENKEAIRERKRLWRQDPAVRQREKERKQRWREANAERDRENQKRWRETNPEYNRTYLRRYRVNGYKAPPDRLRNEIVARLWHDQGGHCYLCEEVVPLKSVVLEHDHRCCPALQFCSACIRGAACQPCNKAIGHMRDDPERLERVAANLRAKLAEMDERLAAKPEQLELGGLT